MAKRLDDTEDRPPTHRHPEVEAAEFEAEQPARDLSGLPKLIISAAKRLELETAPNLAPLELHPGARRHYDEQVKT